MVQHEAWDVIPLSGGRAMILVFIVLLIFWTVLVLYLMHLDRKIQELEKLLEER